ncbi:unnamed protein product [Urochloa humidicola]
MSTPGDSGSGAAAGRSSVAGGRGSRAPTPSSAAREPTPSCDVPAAAAPTSATDGQGAESPVLNALMTCLDDEEEGSDDLESDIIDP